MANATAQASPANGGTATCVQTGTRVNDRYASALGVVDYYKKYRLTASQAAGFRFVGWKTSDSPTPNDIYSTETTIDVEISDYTIRDYGTSSQYVVQGQDVVYTAVFVAVHTVTTVASPPGGGTVSSGRQYDHGSTCIVVAIPAQGYAFVRWVLSTGATSTSSSYRFTVTQDTTATAYFRQLTYMPLHGSSGTILHGSSGSILYDG